MSGKIILQQRWLDRKNSHQVVFTENVNNSHYRRSDRIIMENQINISDAQQNIKITAGP